VRGEGGSRTGWGAEAKPPLPASRGGSGRFPRFPRLPAPLRRPCRDGPRRETSAWVILFIKF